MAIVLIVGPGTARAIDLKPSVFDQERSRLRFEFSAAYSQISDFDNQRFDDISAEAGSAQPVQYKHKSPVKAFLLSMAVPGLGQFYYGSKVKPVIFLGAEVATWALYFKWHGQGDDLTADFEAFNRKHWSRYSYEEEYLNWVYGYTDDDEIPPDEAKGITHHLPDTETQQYFEMTGKYDQFAWGWDDAVLSGQTLNDFASHPGDLPAITGGATVPYSARREIYETMRNDANNKYDNADKMVIVALVNRLISGFEAYFTTQSHNRKVEESSEEFSRLQVRAKLLSYREKRDTPFLQFTYKF